MVLLAAACGGSSPSETVAAPDAATPAESSESSVTSEQAAPTSEGSSGVIDDLAAASRALVDLHGDTGAFDAVAFAMERGYSGEQILVAALAGTLDEEGRIVEAEPAGEPAGVIELAAAHPLFLELDDGTIEEIELAQGCGGTGDGRVAVDWLRCRVAASGLVADPGVELGNEAVFLIMWLATVGYDAAQITDALVLGGTIDLASFEDIQGRSHNCLHLRSGGSVVVPTGSSARSTCDSDIRGLAAAEDGDATDDDTDDGATEDADESSEEPDDDGDDAMVETYEGTVDMVIGALTTDGQRGECSETAPMRLTVYPDIGRVFAVVDQSFSGWEFVAEGPPQCRREGELIELGGVVDADGRIELYYYSAQAITAVEGDLLAGQGSLVRPANDMRYSFHLSRCDACVPVAPR